MNTIHPTAVLSPDLKLGESVTIGAYSVVEDGAVISAYVLGHQFCRIGALAMVGGRTLVRQDIPRIRRVLKMYFFSRLNGSHALQKIGEEFPGDPDAEQFSAFIRASQRGIVSGEVMKQRED